MAAQRPANTARSAAAAEAAAVTRPPPAGRRRQRCGDGLSPPCTPPPMRLDSTPVCDGWREKAAQGRGLARAAAGAEGEGVPAPTAGGDPGFSVESRPPTLEGCVYVCARVWRECRLSPHGGCQQLGPQGEGTSSSRPPGSFGGWRRRAEQGPRAPAGGGLDAAALQPPAPRASRWARGGGGCLAGAGRGHTPLGARRLGGRRLAGVAVLETRLARKVCG